MPAALLIALSATFVGTPSGGEGRIDGVVVNATDGQAPAAGAKVVLRFQSRGQFTLAAETTAGDNGSFRFDRLPIGEGQVYLPGANRDDVHYPGPRVRLSPELPTARVKLMVYNAVVDPSPLVIRRHEIDVRPEPGVLRVTESIIVENPSSTAYVGRAKHPGAKPVTLRLAIPADFDRTTFHKEFYARFSLVNGKLVTGIPWPPGRRQLQFPYLIAGDQGQRLWQRSLDLACRYVKLTVHTNSPEEISCDLGPAQTYQDGQVTFESSGAMPAGHVIRLQLRDLPVPMMAYGRWVALAALVSLVVSLSALSARRRHASRP